MSGIQGRAGRAVQHKVSDAEAAMAEGRVDAGRQLLLEAAEMLAHQAHIAQGVSLLKSHGLHVEAAHMMDRLGDHRQAAQLYAEAKDWPAAARASELVGDLLAAAELSERAGNDLEAGRLYEAFGDHVRAARVFERAGEHDRAARLFTVGLHQTGPHQLTDPEKTEVCRRAGVLYANAGDLDAAVRVLRMGNQLLLAGQLLARGGRRQEAVKLLVEARDYLGAAQVAREMGDDRQANLLMAERAHKDGRLSEAAEHLERAGEYSPAGRFFELVGQHARAAAAYRAGGQHEAAAILFERLGRVEDAAEALREAGRTAEADALANRAAPHDESIRQSVVEGRFYEAAQAALTLARRGERDRYAEVVAYLEEVRAGDPTYFECRTMLAEVLEEMGDTKRALSVLQPIFIGARPERRHVPAMYQYGRLLEIEGFLAGARNAYQTVAAFDPSYRDLQERLRTLRESDVPVFGAPEPLMPAERVPTLPVIVGGPAAKADRPASPASETMALFDRELRAISGEPLAPVPEAMIVAEEVDSGQVLAEPVPSPAEGPITGLGPISSSGALSNGLGVPEPSAPLRPDALVGLVLRGRFRIERKLGRGAQAQVYLARDQVLDREVAIKVLNEDVAEDEKALERFLREARLAARVHHVGCLAIFDFGQERGLTFMAMEYFRGRTLRDALKKGPLAPYVAMRVARDVAAALGAVHEAGIVHRDIKPTNVMVDKAGSIRIADFGVARTLDDGTGSGMMVGTMRYMAPEQARGKDTDSRADVFSLGVVMHEMLAGKPPFGGSLDDLIARVTQPPPELPDDIEVPEDVRQMVRRCMARKPEKRYPNIAALLEDLHRVLPVLRAERRLADNTEIAAEPAVTNGARG